MTVTIVQYTLHRTLSSLSFSLQYYCYSFINWLIIYRYIYKIEIQDKDWVKYVMRIMHRVPSLFYVKTVTRLHGLRLVYLLGIYCMYKYVYRMRMCKYIITICRYDFNITLECITYLLLRVVYSCIKHRGGVV